MILAELCLKDGNTDKAIYYLEKMVDYDLNDYSNIDVNTEIKSPLLNSIHHRLYRSRTDIHQNLMAKLTNSRFDCLKENERYIRLIERTNQ